MSDSRSGDVTGLLREWADGSRKAVDELIPLVYPELRRIARARLRRERRGHILQTTALINEAYLRLVDQTRTPWESRSHFFAICARMMRRILVDHARRRQAEKRGGDLQRVTFDDEVASAGGDAAVDVVVLDRALEGLAELDPRQARIVELRYFGGMTIEETATAVGVSPATVKRDWATARAWLRRKIGRRPGTTDPGNG